MNDLELKKLWEASTTRLEESLTINKQMVDDITRLKVHNMIGSMGPIKIFTLLAGILWVAGGAAILSGIYLHAFQEANKFFLFSATAQILLTAIALIIYIYQLTRIYQSDISQPVLQIQDTLASLRVSTLWSARILFLQLPFWTTFWWNDAMFKNWDLIQWIIPVLVTGAFTYAALWLFFNIRYENRIKRWFKLIFNGREWTPLMRSMELLEQIDEYNGKR